MRAFVFFIFGVLLFPGLAHAKVKAERFSAIAVVEHTGEILHARHADDLRFPASLTKVMTLYMTFEAIKAGELGWDDQIRVSKKASRARPSKLGLQAGTTISVEDAVRALVTKSANDAAIVLAERLSGGESLFATSMTRKARTLGMTHSRFINASGLHTARQVMTARDMAVLAYRIHHDFPSYFRYFSLEKMVWNGRDHTNHNTLLEQVSGVDGLKTGFTNASGYNIAVTAERDGERLIIVVFGGASGAQRDAYATKLLERAFAELKTRRNNGAPDQTPPLDDLSDNTPVLFAGLPSETNQGGGGKRGVQIVIDDDVKTHPTAKPRLPKTHDIGQWGVQVGAYSAAEQAEARRHHIRDIPIAGLIGNAGRVDSGQSNGAPIYRVRFVGLTPPDARAVCKQLIAFGEPCFAVSAEKIMAAKTTPAKVVDAKVVDANP